MSNAIGMQVMSSAHMMHQECLKRWYSCSIFRMLTQMISPPCTTPSHLGGCWRGHHKGVPQLPTQPFGPVQGSWTSQPSAQLIKPCYIIRLAAQAWSEDQVLSVSCLSASYVTMLEVLLGHLLTHSVVLMISLQLRVMS